MRILINLRGSMRVQFMAAVILGLTLSPAPVFGCRCAAPPKEVKTESELAAWTRADAIFEGKVESVEMEIEGGANWRCHTYCSYRPRPKWSRNPGLVGDIALLSR